MLTWATSMKKCIKCKDTKELTEFHKHKGMKDGHLNKCRSCVVEDVAAWRKKNPDCRKKEFQNNKEKHYERMRKWTLNNKEKSNSYKRKWAKKNVDYSNAKTAQRRANKKQATPSWIDNDLVKDMYMEAQYQGMQVDHIVPLTSDKVCGLHWEGNLQLLTAEENQSKGNRYWENQ